MTYQIKLPDFEGPFDLLLFFIERDELDIYDIPIAKITNDFLLYIKELKSLNIDVASEFILVAASLMKIKARMLLPRRELDEEGNEIDPRQELVQKLVEYKRFKAVIVELREAEEKMNRVLPRGYAQKELSFISSQIQIDEELENLSLFKLLKAFNSVINDFSYRQAKTSHEVIDYNYSIESSKKELLSIFIDKPTIHFTQIMQGFSNRLSAIYTFLAMLELLQEGVLQLGESLEINAFEITLTR